MVREETETMPARRKLKLTIPNINMTPLIDVLLVLLIIFMVIQPQKEAKFQSQVPQASLENEKPISTRLLVVEILPGGQGPDQTVELNRQQMSLATLNIRLGEVLAAPEREDKTVIIKAPRDKPFGDVISVVDVVKACRAEPIGIQVDCLS
jgi:biopolymer transport protein ExbD